jgi:hypothetical protein
VYVLQESFEKLAPKRFMALLSIPLIATKLHSCTPFGLCSSKAGKFEIVGAMLDVCAQLLLHLRVDPGALEERGSEGAKRD